MCIYTWVDGFLWVFFWLLGFSSLFFHQDNCCFWWCLCVEFNQKDTHGGRMQEGQASQWYSYSFPTAAVSGVDFSFFFFAVVSSHPRAGVKGEAEQLDTVSDILDFSNVCLYLKLCLFCSVFDIPAFVIQLFWPVNWFAFMLLFFWLIAVAPVSIGCDVSS